MGPSLIGGGGRDRDGPLPLTGPGLLPHRSQPHRTNELRSPENSGVKRRHSERAAVTAGAPSCVSSRSSRSNIDACQAVRQGSSRNNSLIQGQSGPPPHLIQGGGYSVCRRDQPAETLSQHHPPHRLRDRGNRARPEPRFRYPGYDEFRAVVRAAISDAGLLAEAEALALVAHGLREVAQRTAVSERTIRRRFDSAGSPVRDVVRRVRIEATRCRLVAFVPTTVIAGWLGFTNPEAYRRFVRREMGVSIRRIRANVRESTLFAQAGDCGRRRPPLPSPQQT